MKKALVLVAVGLTALTACGTDATAGSEPSPTARETTEASHPAPRLAVTYDGGVQVLDSATGDVLGDFPLKGFTRLNQAGDDRRLLVTEGDHFRILDMGSWSADGKARTTTPQLTDTTFDGEHPGHAVFHGGRTALFYDGEGRVELLDPTTLGDTKPQTTTVKLPKAHHGVALLREDGAMVHTVGDEKSRTGIAITSKDGKQLAENHQCPGVHGEATLKGAMTFGCEDGMLVVKGNQITKVKAPVAYARIGNQAGSEVSSIAFGDWKVDKKAELERPTKVSLVDTSTGKLKLVETGASYSFRSIGRDEAGNGLLLGTDGTLRVIDPAKGTITKKIAVTKPWVESVTWQDPRPTLFVQGHDVWVSEPATKQLHKVDLAGAKVERSITLTQVPNELNGVEG